MEKLICASCNTTETTEYRIESNWDLCWNCHKSWLEHEDYIWDEAQTYPNTYSYKIDAVKD